MSISSEFNTTTATGSNVRELFHAFSARIRLTLAKRKAFNATRAELSKLSSRDLADIGITRSDVTRLAQEAADNVALHA
jgi:uncharacterized protein YjiS (DUF1127 family)